MFQLMGPNFQYFFSSEVSSSKECFSGAVRSSAQADCDDVDNGDDP